MIDISYENALKAAGCEVLAFREFGYYQGRWAAIVRYDGKPGIIVDYYGSCSVCDALQSAVGYDGTHDDLRRFGESYLDSIKESPDEFEAASKWDSDHTEAQRWVREQWNQLGLNNEEAS